MNKRNFLTRSSMGLLALAAPLRARAQPATAGEAFPSRPVRVVVPFAAGNTLDISLRQVSEEFRRNTGQPIIVEAKPGGSGVIAAQAVMQAPPDGYTLLLSNISMLTINPHTFSKLPYDSEKSFRHVTGFLGTSLVMAVPASLPVDSLSDFLKWAKANPSGANFASFTAGNASHFTGVILARRSGVDLVHVPYNGTPPAVTALLGGQVSSAFLPLLAVRPHVEAGRIKVLAVTSAKRSPLIPEVPTFSESGFPELEIYTWAGVSAPAGTPDPVIDKLASEFMRAIRSREIQEKWRAQDFEPLPWTPAEFVAYIRKDSNRWAEAVKISGFRAAD
jgi:tripartite-type tricarboxylate transporter receptor subunit TctC